MGVNVMQAVEKIPGHPLVVMVCFQKPRDGHPWALFSIKKYPPSSHRRFRQFRERLLDDLDEFLDRFDGIIHE